MLSGVGAKARLVRGLAPRHFVFPGTFYLKDLFHVLTTGKLPQSRHANEPLK